MGSGKKMLTALEANAPSLVLLLICDRIPYMLLGDALRRKD